MYSSSFALDLLTTRIERVKSQVKQNEEELFDFQTQYEELQNTYAKLQTELDDKEVTIASKDNEIKV